MGWLQEWGNGRRRDLWQRERERLRLASLGKSEGGGWGWAAGGLGVRAVGRRRAGAALHTRETGTPKVGAGLPQPPGARRRSGAGPAGLPGDRQLPAGYPQAAGAPAEHLARGFGGYFCPGRQRSPGPSPRRRIHRLPRNHGEVI